MSHINELPLLSVGPDNAINTTRLIVDHDECGRGEVTL
jgi:hypothetical protein